MKRQLLSVLLVLTMVLTLTMTVLADGPNSISSSGGALSDGTYEVNDTLILTQQITISGDVTISGSGTIKRGDNLTTYMIVIPEGSSLTLNGITIDGGAVWSGDSDTTLNRGITNSGVSAKAAMIYNFGTLNIEGKTVLQNNSNESQRVSESGVPIFSTTDDSQGTVAYPTSGEETSYGGAVLNGGSMTISGGTIQNNQAFRGAGVCSYGVLTMTDGTITRNHTVAMETAQYADGAGIYQEGGRNGTAADWTATSVKTAYCEISGGSITENVADGNAAGILTENYGKLYLSGSGSITKNICGRVFKNAAGGGVTLYRAYGEITGGEISENISEQANGGGIHLSTSSILKMTGGTVSKNKAADSGGGINIAGGSTVELGSGVKITNNSAKYGGGIYAAGSSTAPTLTISGAEISENTATASGAGVYVSADSVVMKDGSIKENSITSGGESAANIFGGGVYINNTESTFVMQGGSIGKNSLTLDNGTTSNLYAYGAGVYVNKGSFTMSGGSIGGEDSGNKITVTKSSTKDTYAHGAGVSVSKSGSFTMTDGEVSYNLIEAKDATDSSAGNIVVRGGGLYSASAQITLTSGEISNNNVTVSTTKSGNANAYGGGVYLENQSSAVGIGADIKDNSIKAKSSVAQATASGGGLYVTGTASITLSGTVSGNTAAAEVSGGTKNAVANGGGVYTNAVRLTLTGKVDSNKLTANNSAKDSGVNIFGGGVYCASGSLTLENGASISENTLTSSGSGGGGGLRINGSADAVMMNGGMISNNTAATTGSGGIGGGGVDVSSSFTINGGVISGNVADGYHNGGGGIRVNGANALVTMNGGTVSDNIACNIKNATAMQKGGGAFYVLNGGTLDITAGNITGNAALNGGAIAFADGTSARGTVNITGGTIRGNFCTGDSGGAIYMPPAAKSTSGTTSGQTFDQTVAVSGSPVITGNRKGAEISKGNDGKYTVSTDNAATENNIYLSNNNKKGATAVEADYPATQTLTLSGELTAGATLGVTTQTTPQKGTPVQITAAETETQYYEKAEQYFVPDVSEVIAQSSSTGGYVEFAYTSDTYYKVTLDLTNITATGGTITQIKRGETYTAAITAKTGYSLPDSVKSPAAGVALSKNGTTALLTMTNVTSDTTIEIDGVANTYTVAFDPNGGSGDVMESQSMTYDAAAKLTDNSYSKTGYNFAGWSTTAEGRCQYPDGASVKNLTAENGATVTLYAVWTAKKIIPAFDSGDTAVQSCKYDGDSKAYTLTSEIEGFKIEYQQEGSEVTNPKNVGTYDVVISRDEDSTYAAFEQTLTGGLVITAADYPVSITADKTSMTGSGKVTLTVSSTVESITVTGVTCSDETITVTMNSDGTYSADLPNATKTYTFTAQVSGDLSNYGEGPATCTVSVSRRSSEGPGSSTPTYTVSVDKVENGAVSVSPKNASKGTTVTVTTTPDKGWTLETLTVLDKNGKEIDLDIVKPGEKYTFKMPSGKVEVKATFMEDNTMLNYFVDVTAQDYFYDAVLWAVEKGITNGADELHFSPNAPCTRAQIVTFLWRAAGSPAPTSISTFADVPANAYYAKAVAWAVENGITTGTGDGKFSPDTTCTRAQAVTFLFRAIGKLVDSKVEFSDVLTDSYYANAVAWATKNGITTGVGNGLFDPNGSCTRAQIVVFLYRAYFGK